ncbi:hypothetical protein [Streptomyces litchfieldiae]|uniref:Uncharacterized protein n=1 Tax=Streptomyces litchfieldiae TaxID=3075543 RepID=A0ABU2MXQ5_9ACTN|nr:hypothetical protein [Streptomyces sp. DSM 44938]MDT0346427.1 hypothetical protein [Streptomyces sp. DSM 44938]
MHREPADHRHQHPGGPWPAPSPAGQVLLVLRPAARLRWATVTVAAVISLVFLSPAGALGGVAALLATAVVETVVCVLLWMRASQVRVVVTEHQ